MSWQAAPGATSHDLLRGDVGLLTTAGVRDAVEMRRGIREEQYNNRYTNVAPLVPRHLRRAAVIIRPSTR